MTATTLEHTPLVHEQTLNHCGFQSRSILPKCFNSDAILTYSTAQEKFLFKLSSLKVLMSQYLESIDTVWSESLKALHSVKIEFSFSSGQMFEIHKTIKLKATR